MKAIVAAAARAESEERAARVRAAQVEIQAAKGGARMAEAHAPVAFVPLPVPTLFA